MVGLGLNALVWREGDLFVAKAVELELASQGTTEEKAIANLEEAIELYFEDEKVSLKGVLSLPGLQLKKLFPKLTYA